MKLTEKQHRDQLAKAGLPAEDINTLVKAKCDAGEYAPDDEGVEGDDDDEMEKATRKYDADLKKAMELKVRDFATREPTTNATNPETRPPDERVEVPKDIDEVGDMSALTTDIVKGAYEEIADIVEGAVKPLLGKIEKALSAVAQVTKLVAEGNAIMKAQGDLIKAQGAEIKKAYRSERKAHEATQRALGRTPATEQPTVNGSYKVVPEPGERRPVGDVEAVRNTISKALADNGKIAGHERTATVREQEIRLQDAFAETYDPSADPAAILARCGLGLQA